MKPIFSSEMLGTAADEQEKQEKVTPVKTAAKKVAAKKTVSSIRQAQAIDALDKKYGKDVMASVDQGNMPQDDPTPAKTATKRVRKNTSHKQSTPSPAEPASSQTLAQLEREAQRAADRYKAAKDKAKLADARRAVSNMTASLKQSEKDVISYKASLAKAEDMLKKLLGLGK